MHVEVRLRKFKHPHAGNAILRKDLDIYIATDEVHPSHAGAEKRRGLESLIRHRRGPLCTSVANWHERFTRCALLGYIIQIGL